MARGRGRGRGKGKGIVSGGGGRGRGAASNKSVVESDVQVGEGADDGSTVSGRDTDAVVSEKRLESTSSKKQAQKSDVKAADAPLKPRQAKLPQRYRQEDEGTTSQPIRKRTRSYKATVNKPQKPSEGTSNIFLLVTEMYICISIYNIPCIISRTVRDTTGK
jgi:hypothetical protein